MTAQTSAMTGREEFRVRSLRGWDVAFYLMAVIGAGALLTEEPGPTHRVDVALGGLALLVLAYTLLGRPGARRADRRLVTAYLLLLLVAVVVVVWASVVGTLILFIAYSQIWYFAISRLGGVLWSAVLTAGVLGATVVRESVGWAEVPALVAQLGIALAFAVLLGLWITQVAEQGEVRAQLIERLEAAQTELGRSHHAAGVAAERERMAREIHDTLAQGFTSVVMLSQAARADLDRGELASATERLDLVERMARENLAEARALVAAFAPVDLQGGDLVDAVHRLAERFGSETGTQVEVVTAHALPGISRDAEVILLRAAQEALSNVRRHAEAGQVRLELVVEEDDGAATVHLRVTDDGRGIREGAPEGFGLRGMRERVASGGGDVAVTSDDGGTQVRVSLPAGTREAP